MYAKKSALILSIALLFSTPLVMVADEAPVKQTWGQALTRLVTVPYNVVKKEVYPEAGSYVTVRNDKNEIAWTSTARMTVARLALAGAATAAIYFGFCGKKKAKVVKPKATVRNEVAA